MANLGIQCVDHWQCGDNEVCVPRYRNLQEGVRFSVNFGRGKGCYRCNEPPVRQILVDLLPASPNGEPCPVNGNWTEICPRLPQDFTCPEGDDVCDECFEPSTGSFSDFDRTKMLDENLSSMVYKVGLYVYA